MGLKMLTAPAATPVDLAAVKTQARIDYPNAEQDAWITGFLIPGVTERVESFLGRRIMKQKWRTTLPEFPSSGRRAIELPFAAPVYNVNPDLVVVKYVDTAGVLQTLASTEYVLLDDEAPALLVEAYGKSWPVTRAQEQAVQVEFFAGYAVGDQGSPATLVPARIREAILIYCATLLVNRESVKVGTIVTPMPDSARWLLEPLRVVRFAA